MAGNHRLRGTTRPNDGLIVMNETMKRIGLELQKRYRHMLRRPMSWSLIDAFVRLEETEEEAARQHAVQQQSEKNRSKTKGSTTVATPMPDAGRDDI